MQNSQPKSPTGVVNITRNYSSSPAPTGIADYGVENVGGGATAYKMTLSSVTGTAMLDSVNSSSPFGLWSLQLNVVMRVNTTSASYSYWLQNVFTAPWEEHSPLVHADFASAIWNWTAPYASLNSTWVSGGNGGIGPYCYGTGCTGPNPYSYEGGSRCCNYSLPLGLRLRINVSYSGSTVNVDFSGAKSVGTVPLSSNISTYDTVTISEPNPVTGAAILVDGYEMAPGIQLGRQTYYETDFVFAGPSGLATSAFTSMNATISMSYTLNNRSVVAPLSVYEFGETGEKAANLAVTPLDPLHGFQFHVGLGKTISETNYVRQLRALDLLAASYSFPGRAPAGMTAVLDYVNNGTETFATLGTSPMTFRADAATDWRVITKGLQSNSTVRWAPSPANGTVSGTQTVQLVYYHQILVHLGFEVTGGGSGYSVPMVSFTQFGSAASALAGSSTWMDAGTSYSYPALLPGSNASKRWISNATSGNVPGPGEIHANYQLQYGVTIESTIDGSVSYAIRHTTGTIAPSIRQTFYVQPGTDLVLSASPISFWYEFRGWSGAGNGTGSQIQETIEAPTSIKGEFSVNAVNLIVILGIVGGILVLGVYAFRRRPAIRSVGRAVQRVSPSLLAPRRDSLNSLSAYLPAHTCIRTSPISSWIIHNSPGWANGVLLRGPVSRAKVMPHILDKSLWSRRP